MGDQILVASCVGRFYAIDRETGEERWRFDITDDGGSQFHCEMLVQGDQVVFGTDGRRGNAHALDITTGEARWMYECGKAFRTDVRENGETIIGVARKESVDELFCVDADDGDVVWTVDHEKRDRSGYLNTPLILENDVLYGATDGRLYRYDGATGDVVESHDLGAPITTGLWRDGQIIYGGMSEGRLFRFDLQAETVAIGDAGQPITTMPKRVGPVVVALTKWRSAKSMMVAKSLDLSSTVWTWSPEDETDFGTIARVTVHDGAIVVGTQKGAVFALDPIDGREVWRTKVDEAVRSVGFHDGVMLVGSIPSELYAIRLPERLRRATTNRTSRP